jgi:hypothetical protein
MPGTDRRMSLLRVPIARRAPTVRRTGRTAMSRSGVASSARRRRIAIPTKSVISSRNDARCRAPAPTTAGGTTSPGATPIAACASNAGTTRIAILGLRRSAGPNRDGASSASPPRTAARTNRSATRLDSAANSASKTPTVDRVNDVSHRNNDASRCSERPVRAKSGEGRRAARSRRFRSRRPARYRR